MKTADIGQFVIDECFKKAAELMTAGYSQDDVETYMNGAVWGVELSLQKFMSIYIDDLLQDNLKKHEDAVQEAKDRGFTWF